MQKERSTEMVFAMKQIEDVKIWVDVIASSLTTFALIVGGAFGAYQYLEKAHDDRVKETLNFLDRYNRDDVAKARGLQQEKWAAYFKEESETAGKDYDAFIKRVIAEEGLESSIAVLNDFYTALEICTRNKICDPDVALQLFQEDACSFLNRHFGFIDDRRKMTGDQAIGRGTELFARDSRGAATVSCIKKTKH